MFADFSWAIFVERFFGKTGEDVATFSLNSGKGNGFFRFLFPKDFSGKRVKMSPRFPLIVERETDFSAFFFLLKIRELSPMKNTKEIQEIQENALPIFFDSSKEKTFTGAFSPVKIRRGERRLSSPSPEASRLALAICHRLENPDSPRAWLARVKEGKAGQAKLTREKSLAMKPHRPLSLQDRQDVCQEVFAMLAMGIEPQTIYFFTKKEGGDLQEVQGISLIFRACRDLLKMNGGNHDRAKGESLDDLSTFRPSSLAMPHTSEEERERERIALADKIRILRKRAFSAFSRDTSRQKRQNLKSALSIIRHLSASLNAGGVLKPRQWENGGEHDKARQKSFARFRSYLSGSPSSLAEELRQSMTALA